MLSPSLVVVTALLAAVSVTLVLAIPRSTQVRAGRLEIRSLLHTWTYPLSEIAGAEPVKLDPLRTLRLGASGWPLPPVGWMRDKAHGRFRALASSRANLHIVRFRDGRLLLVSLADMEPLRLPVP